MSLDDILKYIVAACLLAFYFSIAQALWHFYKYQAEYRKLSAQAQDTRWHKYSRGVLRALAR